MRWILKLRGVETDTKEALAVFLQMSLQNLAPIINLTSKYQCKLVNYRRLCVVFQNIILFKIHLFVFFDESFKQQSKAIITPIYFASLFP